MIIQTSCNPVLNSSIVKLQFVQYSIRMSTLGENTDPEKPLKVKTVKRFVVWSEWVMKL